MLRAQTEGDRSPGVFPQSAAGSFIQWHGKARPWAGAFVKEQNPVLFRQRALKKIHRRRADEPGDKPTGGTAVNFLRPRQLPHRAVLHHRQRVGQSQGFGLVVRDENHGRAEPSAQAGDFAAQLQAQGRVQVGERFVEQKNPRMAHQGAAQGGALAFAAGHLGGPPLQQGRQPEHFRRRSHAGGRFRRGEIFAASTPAPRFQKAVKWGNKRVVLENHGDIAVLGRTPASGLPSSQMLPSSGVSSPAIRRKVVVLPQPEGRR